MMVGMKVIIAMIIIVMMNDLAKKIAGLTWWQPVRRLSIERVPLPRNLERSNINIDIAFSSNLIFQPKNLLLHATKAQFTLTYNKTNPPV